MLRDVQLRGGWIWSLGLKIIFLGAKGILATPIRQRLGVWGVGY